MTSNELHLTVDFQNAKIVKQNFERLLNEYAIKSAKITELQSALTTAQEENKRLQKRVVELESDIPFEMAAKKIEYLEDINKRLRNTNSGLANHDDDDGDHSHDDRML